MLTREIPWTETRAGQERLKRFVATSLRSAAWALGRMARRLRKHDRVAEGLDPVLEFYAQAGAPEGALYVNGKLVGHLPGVSRL